LWSARYLNRVQACGICHSDVLTKEGMWPGIQYPRVPGHEEAEQRHIESLRTLYEKYDVPLPASHNPDQVDIPDSLLKACQLGVDAEIENITLYDRLIEATDLPDVVEVLKRLQAASRDNHLPAFQRCVERGGAAGRGPGSGRRGGKPFGTGDGPGRKSGRPRR
jgi:hypothetical protein